MLRASLATPRHRARVSACVIQLEEGSSVHLVHIVANVCLSGVLVECIDVDEELAVICDSQPRFLLKLRRPKIACVTPRAVVLFFTPRVPHVDELGSVRELLRTQDSEGVAQGEADCVLLLIVATVGAYRHDIPIGVSGDQAFPKVLLGYFLVDDRVPRSTIKRPDSEGRLSARDVRVVSVQLGEGFL